METQERSKVVWVGNKQPNYTVALILHSWFSSFLSGLKTNKQTKTDCWSSWENFPFSNSALKIFPFSVSVLYLTLEGTELPQISCSIFPFVPSDLPKAVWNQLEIGGHILVQIGLASLKFAAAQWFTQIKAIACDYLTSFIIKQTVLPNKGMDSLSIRTNSLPC